MEDIARAVSDLLHPRVFVGCTASTVVGGAREIEDAGGIALWAATGIDVAAHRLAARREPDGVAISGLPRSDDLAPDTKAILVLADPYSFPVEHLLEGLRSQPGLDLPVVGGLASAARGPGGNRLVLDGDIFSEGAIAVT